MKKQHGTWLKPIYISGDAPQHALYHFAKELAQLKKLHKDQSINEIENVWKTPIDVLDQHLGELSIINSMYISFGINGYTEVFWPYHEELNELTGVPDRRHCYLVNPAPETFGDWLSEAYYADRIHLYLKRKERGEDIKDVWSLVSREDVMIQVLSAARVTPVLIECSFRDENVYKLKRLKATNDNWLSVKEWLGTIPFVANSEIGSYGLHNFINTMIDELYETVEVASDDKPIHYLQQQIDTIFDQTDKKTKRLVMS